MFAGKAGAYPSEAPFQFRKIVTYGRKKFYNIDTRSCLSGAKIYLRFCKRLERRSNFCPKMKKYKCNVNIPDIFTTGDNPIKLFTTVIYEFS